MSLIFLQRYLVRESLVVSVAVPFPQRQPRAHYRVSTYSHGLGVYCGLRVACDSLTLPLATPLLHTSYFETAQSYGYRCTALTESDQVPIPGIQPSTTQTHGTKIRRQARLW